MDVAEVLLRRWRATGLPTSTPQDFDLTLWSLGRRTGEGREQVLAQFAAGEIVRTHALRQTWHLVHRDDLEWVQAATAPRVHGSNAALYRQEGLDAQTMARAGDVILRAVGERPGTRAEVGRALAAAGFELTPFRLGILMMWAELECLVVSGPVIGRQHTYIAWSGGPRARGEHIGRPDRQEAIGRPDRQEAIGRLAERYLRSHGPASLADFTAWSSLTLTEARDAVATLPVHRQTVEGVELLWLGGGGADPWASPQVELLNGYDEYVSGVSAAGKRWIDRAGLRRDRRGTPLGLVVADGRLAGHWRRTERRTGVVVDVLPLRPFEPGEMASLEENADRFGRFLGTPATVSLRPLEA